MNSQTILSIVAHKSVIGFSAAMLLVLTFIDYPEDDKKEWTIKRDCPMARADKIIDTVHACLMTAKGQTIKRVINSDCIAYAHINHCDVIMYADDFQPTTKQWAKALEKR